MTIEQAKQVKQRDRATFDGADCTIMASEDRGDHYTFIVYQGNRLSRAAMDELSDWRAA